MHLNSSDQDYSAVSHAFLSLRGGKNAASTIVTLPPVSMTLSLIILFSPRIVCIHSGWQLRCRGWSAHLCNRSFTLELVYRRTSQKRSLIVLSNLRGSLAVACFVDILNRCLLVLCLFPFTKPNKNTPYHGNQSSNNTYDGTRDCPSRCLLFLFLLGS